MVEEKVFVFILGTPGRVQPERVQQSRLDHGEQGVREEEEEREKEEKEQGKHIGTKRAHPKWLSYTGIRS